jgi:acyl-coenzyme A thioesterase PaaI-like protein
MPPMSADELERFLHSEFPQIDEHRLRIKRVGDHSVRVRMPYHERDLRPDGAPSPADVIAEARLLARGRRLAVGDVALYSDGVAEIVAHAVLTYSIPRGR